MRPRTLARYLRLKHLNIEIWMKLSFATLLPSTTRRPVLFLRFPDGVFIERQAECYPSKLTTTPSSNVIENAFQPAHRKIVLYGSAQSTCTQRVLTTLIEKGLEYELKNVDLATGEHKVLHSTAA